MARKPGRMYRFIRGQPATRKEYTGGIPNPHITQFVLGNKTDDFPIQLELRAEEKCQIRHTSLESARVTANRAMEKKTGPANYRLKVRVYPHVIIRENKQATGAGADRVSQGMRASFGKNVGTAARVNTDQIVMTIETTEENVDTAKNALRKAGMKLPTPCKIELQQVKKHSH